MKDNVGATRGLFNQLQFFVENLPEPMNARIDNH
jgi:hypothetical protein